MKLRYGEGSIEQRGERWRAKWYGTDGQRHTKTFPSHEAAAAHLLEVSTRKRRRRYRDPSSLTVAEAVEDWLERGAARWKPATLTSYAHRLEKHVLPRFGSRRVADLTAAEIQAWVDSLRLSPASVVSVQRTLVTVLSDCVRRGIVDHNVAQSVEVPGQRRQRIVTWTPAEVRRVLSYTSQDRRWHAVYHLALSTGMRPGELRALHWADIDPDAGTVTVRRTAVRIDGVMTVQNLTKTEEVRVIRLTPACLAAVEAWRSASRHELVMCYRYGTVVSDVTWRQWHERMCEAAGVRVIGLHGLRHTFATLLLRSGIDVKVVSAMLGHSSVTFTMDTYMHVDTDMQAGAVTALAGVLGET